MKNNSVYHFKHIVKNIKSYGWLISVLLIYLIYFLIIHPMSEICIVKIITGLPCPFCGITRASLHLLTFQFAGAFYYHPLVFLLPFVVLIVSLRHIHVFNKLYFSKSFWGILLILLIGVYILRMLLYFPSQSPMDYYYQSYIYKIFMTY
ncbi:MAG: DUF2752 domain-containing protein [Candidatus Izimaplasma sp.]|nr:DUF2752 domain-containing protein [Candidatus Izimaplasma bacterium]